MKVWIVKGDYNGRWCFDAENSSTSSSLIYDFQDKGIVRDWKKARVSFESGDKKTDILPIQNISYFASNPHLFICDTYAKKKIEEKIKYVQFLQVEPIEKNIADGTCFYLPNINKVACVLDESKTKYKYVLDKYISGVEKHYFIESALDNPIFYLNINNRDHAFLPIYATDEFKDYVEICGITGFRFKEVFDFDDPDKEYPLI